MTTCQAKDRVAIKKKEKSIMYVEVDIALAVFLLIITDSY